MNNTFKKVWLYLGQLSQIELVCSPAYSVKDRIRYTTRFLALVLQ